MSKGGAEPVWRESMRVVLGGQRVSFSGQRQKVMCKVKEGEEKNQGMKTDIRLSQVWVLLDNKTHPVVHPVIY